MIVMEPIQNNSVLGINLHGRGLRHSHILYVYVHRPKWNYESMHVYMLELALKHRSAHRRRLSHKILSW